MFTKERELTDLKIARDADRSKIGAEIAEGDTYNRSNMLNRIVELWRIEDRIVELEAE